MREAAERLATMAREASSMARIGYTFRRTPGIASIRDLIRSGVLGRVLHFSGRYWTDYGCSPSAPMSWRYRGGPGSGALADVGSHLSYVAEFLHDEPSRDGYRQVILGPQHPYLSRGLAMDAPSVGFGQNDAFAYQARAFLGHAKPDDFYRQLLREALGMDDRELGCDPGR